MKTPGQSRHKFQNILAADMMSGDKTTQHTKHKVKLEVINTHSNPSINNKYCVNIVNNIYDM